MLQSRCYGQLSCCALLRRWGCWDLPASVGHAYRTVVGSEVGEPVRCDGRAVRQQFTGVLEDHYAVAEQTASRGSLACQFGMPGHLGETPL